LEQLKPIIKACLKLDRGEWCRV